MFRGGRGGPRGTRVYVGGLEESVKKEDLESEFEKYGKLNSVWVAFNPPGFAFVEFANQQDAETACDNMNNSSIFGSKLKVEISRGRGRGGRGFDRGGRGGGMDRFSSGGGGFRGGSRGRDSYDRDGGDSRGFRGGGRGGRGRGGGRFDDFGGGGGGGRFSGDREFGGRENGIRNGFGDGRRSFDSSRDFGGRSSRGGGFRGGRGGGGGFGGGERMSRGDYGEYDDFGGAKETSRFRSRSPIGRGSRQAY